MNHCHCLSNSNRFAFNTANIIVGHIDYVNCLFSAWCCTALRIFMFTNECSNSLVAL